MLWPLFIAALWSPEGKGLALALVYCDFVTFPFGILGQVWYLIECFLILTVFLTLRVQLSSKRGRFYNKKHLRVLFQLFGEGCGGLLF